VFNKVRQVHSTVAIILLNLLLLFVVVEIGSALIINAYWYLDSYEPWKNHPYYAQQEWSADYWRETTPRTGIYQPYVNWKSAPYHGELLNINESGLRVTPNSEEDNPSLSIFCFGGSTMWGWGSPDWGTIPAHLAEIINTQFREESVKVVNYGQRIYISSQEVIQLIEEIKHGNVPDIVIFYDGVNDVGTAYSYGPGVPYDVWKIYRQGRIEAVKEQGTIQKLIDLSLDLKSSRVAQWGLRTLSSKFGYQQSRPFPGKAIDIDELSRETVSIYLSNMDIVDALSQKYGFDYYFFWQPSLLHEESKPLTWREQEVRQVIVTRSGFELIEFRHTVYNMIKSEAEKRANLHYIADIFNNTPDLVFIDSAHLTPEGNKLVAEKMADIIAGSMAH
jgi:hypothetical protein|tara:strand:- start:319 stop:1488 length:1170 start_codon:yes stop_codon:yes gene_type:complete